MAYEPTRCELRLDWPVILLYILAVSLMTAHGIDSTRFGEWRLLGLSPWVYVLSYVPFTAFFLFGFIFLVRGERRGYGMSLFVGLLVSSVIVLHAPQLFGGVRLFHTLESVTLILACALTGLWLVAASAWRLGEYDRPGVRTREPDQVRHEERSALRLGALDVDECKDLPLT